MRVFNMNKKLKSFALAVAAVLGGGGLASAQQGAPVPPPASVSPYQLAPAPVLVSQPSPSDASYAASCVSKGGGGCDGNCGGHDCENCNCRDPRGLWGGFEFMFMWGKGQDLPPLVTTSSLPTPINEAGRIGFPNTSVLYGADRVGDQFQAAGRFTIGKWFDEEESMGVGIRYLMSEGDRSRFSLDSDQNSVIARPFYNVDPLNTGSDSWIVAYPGVATGNVSVATSSDMYNIDVLGRVNLDFGTNHRLDLIGGFQNARLDTGLMVVNSTTVLGNNDVYQMQDGFDARNIFNGGSIGVWYERYRGPWVVSMLAKFSIGQMSETVRIRGSNTVDTGGGPVTTPGGLLAQPTNIGDYHRNETAFVPEFALNLNRRLTDHLDLSFGYTIIYFSSVVLAGDQIDVGVNGAQLLNGPQLAPFRPAFNGFNDTDYFVHGITLGLNFHF